ncbi:MAG TPA: FAD-dependent oxidoreductase, partial [Gemmatimonadales bacterium]|nr:FAD-dependent oxidoreductase [Gemmatimonadales bacterium]
WLMDGRAFPYEALLIATGATPVRLSLPGAGADRVHYLRTLDDCRKIIASADRADTAVLIGSGFIGLEAAAALRTRGLEVHIVSPDRVPLERVLGSTLGTRLQQLHEAHGVVFHLGRTVTEITEQAVRLQDGSIIPAKLVLAAIGVQPNTGLASRAGLVLNRGIQVDRFLETSVTGVFAAGDVARWPDPRTGEAIRFEHWVTAERQGQTAARNMLGRGEAFEAIPFFWTQQYDQRINYSGHAPAWDRLDISAGLPPDQWEQRYYQGDELIAVATIGRDKVNLAAELELERGIGARRPGRASMGVTVPSGGVR